MDEGELRQKISQPRLPSHCSGHPPWTHLLSSQKGDGDVLISAAPKLVELGSQEAKQEGVLDSLVES